MIKVEFDWDSEKDEINQSKHKVSFYVAQHTFSDPKRVILEDIKHSETEKRYFCIGKVNNEVLTVRFTYREHKIRIIGAGYWRKGRQYYEKKNRIHK